MALPKNTSSGQNALCVTVPLVVGRYLEGVGEAAPFVQGVLRRCHWCDTDSCIFVPDGTGDWWVRCTACSRCWNLFADLRRRNGLSAADAVDWLVQHGVMGRRDDAALYAEVSAKKQAILDWFDRHRLASIQSGEARRVIPGEWAQCQMHPAFEFLRELGLHEPMIDRRLHCWLSMHRTINGIPCQISINKCNLKQVRELDLPLCQDSQRGYFVDGILGGGGGSVYVITSERLRDLAEIPPERPLFVVTSRGRWSSYFHPPPAWSDIILLSEARTLNADLIKNASLLGSGALVRVGNLVMDIDDAMIERAWWPGITGFALQSGAISSSAMTRIVETIAVRKDSSIKSVLGAIHRNSELITEKFSPPGMTIIPDGMATQGSPLTLDGRKVRLGRAPARLCNFQLFRLSSDDQAVLFALVASNRRAEFVVPVKTASDSNLLITELHAVARENNMGGLVVYRQPPYPKDLLTNARK